MIADYRHTMARLYEELACMLYRSTEMRNDDRGSSADDHVRRFKDGPSLGFESGSLPHFT